MKTTTTNLSMDRRARLSYWWHSRGERMVRDGLWGAVMVVFVLLIHSLLRPVEQPLQPVVQQPGAMLIATATAGPVVPTWTPAPTMPPIVQVQEVYIQAEPQVVYVPVAAPVEDTPPTMPPYEPQPQDITEEKPADDRAAHYAAATSGHGSKSIGGSGRMPAPDIAPIGGSGSDLCAAAAAANAGARCVGGQP